MSKALEVDLPAEIFDVQVNVPLIHQVVVAQLAAARQGTHSTKTRGEVRESCTTGSENRLPWFRVMLGTRKPHRLLAARHCSASVIA